MGKIIHEQLLKQVIKSLSPYCTDLQVVFWGFFFEGDKYQCNGNKSSFQIYVLTCQLHMQDFFRHLQWECVA